MDDLFDKLSRYVEAGAAAPVLPPGAAPDGLPDWHAELGREHGLRVRRAAGEGHPPEPAEPEPAGPEPDPTRSWQAELMREHLRAPTRSSRPPHGAPPPSTLELKRLPPDPAGFSQASIPRDFGRYRALVHEVFDAPRRQLASRLAAQPICRAAYAVWVPGALRANLNVTYEVFDHVSAIMGEVYGFRPADMGYWPDMSGMWGSYREATRQVYFSDLLLHQPVSELFATVIHEQIHKLQGELVWRLAHPSARPLTHPERALAYYWLREDRVIARLYAQAFADMAQGRGDARYRRIGKEYHAFDTEESVVPVLSRAFGRR